MTAMLTFLESQELKKNKVNRAKTRDFIALKKDPTRIREEVGQTTAIYEFIIFLRRFKNSMKKASTEIWMPRSACT